MLHATPKLLFFWNRPCCNGDASGRLNRLSDARGTCHLSWKRERGQGYFLAYECTTWNRSRQRLWSTVTRPVCKSSEDHRYSAVNVVLSVMKGGFVPVRNDLSGSTMSWVAPRGSLPVSVVRIYFQHREIGLMRRPSQKPWRILPEVNVRGRHISD